MEGTMRRAFLITAVLLSAAAAHAGPDLAIDDPVELSMAPTPPPLPSAPLTPLPTTRSSASPASCTSDGDLAAKRQAMMQQKMEMQKQIAMQRQMAIAREMRRHPIRTRLHFALLKFRHRF
jgi:hypothetical protein